MRVNGSPLYSSRFRVLCVLLLSIVFQHVLFLINKIIDDVEIYEVSKAYVYIIKSTKKQRFQFYSIYIDNLNCHGILEIIKTYFNRF